MNAGDKKYFVSKLNEAQELMRDEKYKQAILLLEKLKILEKEGDFNYNLTHKLYQLLSNAQSLYNQKIILEAIKSVSNQNSISFQELNQMLSDNSELNIDIVILGREVEILILRGLLSCKIEGDKLIF